MTKARFGSCLAFFTLLVTGHSLADVAADMQAESSGGDVGSQMSADGGGEAKAGGGTAARGGDGGGQRISGDGFASVDGPTGAGLSLDPGQRGRFWGELGLHTQDRVSVFSPLLGFGYKVIDVLELEVVLPLAYASYDFGLVEDSAFELGNPYVGVNYLGGSGTFRYKVGGGIAVPLADADDGGQAFALYSAAALRGYQQIHYWLPDTLSLYGPGRIEFGDKVVFGLDMSLGVHVYMGDNDNNDDVELTTTVAPGVGVYLGDARRALVGGRLAIFWAITGDGDNAQVALEPYFRYNWDSAFFNTRLTLNVDEPLGFAFDEGRFWGLHVGGGLLF